MRLFHAPGSCSLGIRILLEEIGVDYDLQIVDLRAGRHRTSAYLALNPKGKVPALVRDDGSVLTEFPAIALWLAKSYPEAGLLPPGLEAEVRALEWLDFIVASLHMRGATLANLPQKFTANPEAQKELRTHGQAVLRAGLDQLETTLSDGRAYLMGTFSVVDAAAFYLLAWKERFGLELPPQVSEYFDRLAERPAVARALAAPPAA